MITVVRNHKRASFHTAVKRHKPRKTHVPLGCFFFGLIWLKHVNTDRERSQMQFH